jgi:hypothetical protein
MTHSRMHKKKRQVGKRSLEIAFLALMIGLVVFTVHGWFIQQRSEEINSSRKAALIDQLSIAYPNPSFTDEFTKILKDSGFTSDVYSGAEVNIDLYRRLPSLGYRLIIFRVHQSTPVEYLLPNDRPVTGSPVYLFTGEPYDQRKYLVEQLSDLVVPAREINGSKIYFAIGPQFVQSMSGKFPSTVIILAGCSGLYSADLADSFIVKGASVVVGWQRFVQMDYTDKAIVRFLRAMLVERNTIFRSIMTMTSDVGLDPTYKTNLLCYPEERIGLTFSEAIELKEKVIVTQQIGVQFVIFSKHCLKPFQKADGERRALLMHLLPFGWSRHPF